MREELTLENLPVSGAIPPGLDGLYLKMGANPVRTAVRGRRLVPRRRHGARSRDQGRQGAVVPQPLDRLAARPPGRFRRPAAPGSRRGGNDTVNTNVVEIGGRILRGGGGWQLPRRNSRGPWRSSATTRSTARWPAPSPGTRTATH
ncbi:hypothetical protein ACU4GA_31125 [Methylobacterium oryzae CBMB20]